MFPITAKTLTAFCGLVSLTACVGTGQLTPGDSGPDRPMDVSHIPDAVPRVEPRTAAGNKSPYTVLGKTYHLLASSEAYREQGVASWYGRKFHGSHTSNGEIYDMYGMTAAHKTLPIPTFVQVTNLENDRQVVVRVNDRGPFHGDRIIDLTYAAAKKLGFVDQGTAPVEVVAIDPEAWAADTGQATSERVATAVDSGEPRAPSPSQSAGYQLPDNTFLQAGAFGSRESATALQNKLTELTSYPVIISPMEQVGDALRDVQALFRVRIGPITDNWELLNLKDLIQEQRLGVPHVVRD